MIDVSRKSNTLRIATAQATLTLDPSTRKTIEEGNVPKGDPLAVAKVAAIQAVKNTSNIIPYCHPMPVDFVGVEFAMQDRRIDVTVVVKAIHKTGVEMEALTGASVAALTLYDMLKMLDESMTIEAIRLVEKRGGKSDFRNVYKTPLRAAVLVMSDSIASGDKDDASGKRIVERLEAERFDVVEYEIVPDEPDTIKQRVIRYADELGVDLVMTTGGTGFGPRDSTPEAMADVIEREAPGVVEAARGYGQERTPYSMLSRGRAGMRGNTLIVNLPGSRKGVAESLDALFPGILHAFSMLQGGGHGGEG